MGEDQRHLVLAGEQHYKVRCFFLASSTTTTTATWCNSLFKSQHADGYRPEFNHYFTQESQKVKSADTGLDENTQNSTPMADEF